MVIISPIDFATGGADIVQGVEDAFVMNGLGKDTGNIAPIIAA